jgi:hypothetical protein
LKFKRRREVFNPTPPHRGDSNNMTVSPPPCRWKFSRKFRDGKPHETRVGDYTTNARKGLPPQGRAPHGIKSAAIQPLQEPPRSVSALKIKKDVNGGGRAYRWHPHGNRLPQNM